MVLSLASSPPHTTTNDTNSTPAPPHLPHFSGEYPFQWISQAERYFEFHGIYDDDRFPYVIEVFDDEPFSWFNSWFRGPGRLTWKSFTTAMLHRFHPTTASNNGIPTPAPKQPSQPCPLTPQTKPKPAPQMTRPSINYGTQIITRNTHFLPMNNMDPKAAGRRDWRPPPYRLVENNPNATGRREWRPPWVCIPSLRTRTFFGAGVLIRA